jgi:hypothetical protein
MAEVSEGEEEGRQVVIDEGAIEMVMRRRGGIVVMVRGWRRMMVGMVVMMWGMVVRWWWRMMVMMWRRARICGRLRMKRREFRRIGDWVERVERNGMVILPDIVQRFHDDLLGRQRTNKTSLEIRPETLRKDEPSWKVELRVRPPESNHITKQREERKENSDVGPFLTLWRLPIPHDLTVGPDRGCAQDLKDEVKQQRVENSKIFHHSRKHRIVFRSQTRSRVHHRTDALQLLRGLEIRSDQSES